ncbi:hypothetical protein BDZ89DRAFT_1054663, partial [Hymenopellis radicata]
MADLPNCVLTPSSPGQVTEEDEDEDIKLWTRTGTRTTHQVTDEDEDDATPSITPFKKGWLRGEALEYARNLRTRFFEAKTRSTVEATAYGKTAANEMMRVFGVMGPWGVTSKARNKRTQGEGATMRTVKKNLPSPHDVGHISFETQAFIAGHEGSAGHTIPSTSMHLGATKNTDEWTDGSQGDESGLNELELSQNNAQDVEMTPDTDIQADALSKVDPGVTAPTRTVEGHCDEGEALVPQDKGKGRVHATVSVVDEYGEQMEMGISESITLRMQMDGKVTFFEGKKMRRTVKETAELKNTVDEEHPISIRNPDLLITLGAELPNKLDEDLSSKDHLDEQGRLAPGFPSQESEFTRLRFTTQYSGSWIKEVRRAFKDRKVDTTKVLLIPFRSTYEEKPVAYNLSRQDEDDDMEEVDWSNIQENTLPAPGMLVTGLKEQDYNFLVKVGALLHREGLNFG